MQLERVTVSIDNLLLDPNNPRFADISNDGLNIPEKRFAEVEIQADTFNKMMQPTFDVGSLAKSIETVGFLPVDSIVARSIEGGKYVVVEGNRRTAAIKHLIAEYNRGQSILEGEKIEELKNLEIMVVSPAVIESGYLEMVIQGVRNVSGIKEWNAFQKAQFISNMIEKGKDPTTISKMIGMPVREVNRYYKTYCAMDQFKTDLEYGSLWKHSYFSHLDEVIKKPALRTYFGWNEESYRFDNLTNIHRFYDWITNDENGGFPTIKDSHEIRQLGELIYDTVSLNYLDEGNLQAAINYINSKNQSKNIPTFSDCMAKIRGAIQSFKDIIAEGYEKEVNAEEVDFLEKAIADMTFHVGRIKKLNADD